MSSNGDTVRVAEIDSNASICKHREVVCAAHDFAVWRTSKVTTLLSRQGTSADTYPEVTYLHSAVCRSASSSSSAKQPFTSIAIVSFSRRPDLISFQSRACRSVLREGAALHPPCNHQPWRTLLTSILATTLIFELAGRNGPRSSAQPWFTRSIPYTMCCHAAGSFLSRNQRCNIHDRERCLRKLGLLGRPSFTDPRNSGRMTGIRKLRSCDRHKPQVQAPQTG